MKFRILHDNANWVDWDSDLKKKALHYVGFAELGLAFFRGYLMSTFNCKLDEAIRLCEQINLKDETGTIYPRGCMTGLPVRFFRSPLNHSNINQFRSCLRDAFVANRDYCKSRDMVFDYRCAISNRDKIIDETIQMANGISDDPILKTVTILADDASACTALQRTVFPKERDDKFKAMKKLTENWLHSYLIDSVQRNLCTQIYCTTCRAMEFRQGIFYALAKATNQQSSPPHAQEIIIGITQALADVRPNSFDVGRLEAAARCLVFDICHAIGEVNAAFILGESWGGNVLRRMQEHHRAALAARRASDEYENPASVRKRHEEKKRIAQEEHQQRLALKVERDRVWRESQRKADGQTDDDA